MKQPQRAHNLVIGMLSSEDVIWAGNHSGWGGSCSKAFYRLLSYNIEQVGHESSAFPMHQKAYLQLHLIQIHGGNVFREHLWNQSLQDYAMEECLLSVLQLSLRMHVV